VVHFIDPLLEKINLFTFCNDPKSSNLKLKFSFFLFTDSAAAGRKTPGRKTGFMGKGKSHHRFFALKYNLY
jgi:hypothetical protein